MEPQAKHAEKRIYPRFELDVRIAVRGTRDGKRVEWRGRTVDISEGGVAAVLSTELEKGEVVEVEFTLPHRTQPIHSQALVRHRESFRYGLEFFGISADQREAIRDAGRLLNPAP